MKSRFEWIHLAVFVLSAMMFATCLGCMTAIRPMPVATSQVTGQVAAALSIRVDCVTKEQPITVKTWVASGVALGDRHVLTAAHAVPAVDDGCIRATMVGVFSDGKKYALRPDAVLIGDDVARLVSVSSFDQPFTHKIGKAKLGEVVCIVAGEPEREIKCGRAERFADFVAGDLEHGAPTVRGNSGSGLYNRRGELIAIVTHERHNLFMRPVGGRATVLAPWGRRWIAVVSK